MTLWVDAFIQALRATGVVSRAARAAGISSATAYNLKARDADFANAWDNAMEDATDELEIEMRDRALHGVHEPVVYQGQLTPVWARDADGELVLETYQVDTGKKDENGFGIFADAQRPVQARLADGSLQWLTVNKKSDALLMFAIKGNRRKYGTDAHEITGKDGAPLAVVDETKRTARIAAILELAKQRKGASFEDLL